MYTPNNDCTYAKAFAGAMAGLGASGRYILDSNLVDAGPYARMADAYAQEFDATWGATAPTSLEQDLIFGASIQVWIGVSPLVSAVAFIPGAYAGLVNAAIALAKEGNAQVVAEGIDPNGCAAGAADVFYAHLRANKQFWVTDPTMAGGAVGNFVHDDTPSFNAAIAAALAANGEVVVTTPSVAWRITSELVINGPVRMRGQSDNMAQPPIRAAAPMRSLIALRATFGSPQPEDQAPDRALITDITLDANFMADNCMILLGAEFSQFSRLQCINALKAGIREAVMQFAATLSGVTATVPGGSPAGVTVVQADPNYVGLSGPGPFHLVLKIQDAGTTYALSVDNGATFATYHQPFTAAKNSNIARADNVNKPSVLTGITASFPAGVYHDNDTYAFSVTLNLGDYTGDPVTGNSDITYEDLVLGQCGSLYITAGMPGSWGAYNVTTIAGTAATTIANQIIVGTATSWNSLRGAGSTRMMLDVNGGGIIFQGIVLDDTHFAVVTGTEPAVNVAGAAFAMSGYAGVYEDGLVDGMRGRYVRGHVGDCVVGLSCGGQQGPKVQDYSMHSTALGGVSIGGSTSDPCTGTVLSGIHNDSGSVFGYWLSPNSTGVVIQPTGGLLNGINGLAQSWVELSDGSISPFRIQGAQSLVPIHSLTLLPSTQNITAAGQQIQIPDVTKEGALGNTSYIRLTSNADYLLNATPVIPPAQSNTMGAVVILHNTGPHVLSFRDHGNTLSGLETEAAYTSLGVGDMIAFIGTGGTPYIWTQIWRNTDAYSNGNPMGNTGEGRFRLQTVSSAAAALIYQVDVVNSGIAAGTLLKFDVQAQSQAGATCGWWQDCMVAWDVTGTQVLFTIGSAFGITGGVAGSIPLGWAISIGAPVGGYAPIKVAGDVSANTVTWTIVVKHRDPGQ
jgi:hypothetical protein